MELIRIHISKLKQKVFELGGKIYYSDTDSLVTDIAMPDDFISNKTIGKLKLEHKVDKGYFISNKTYLLVLENKKTIIKSKGVLNSSLTINDFIDMYKGHPINSGIKTSAIKGSVTITENTNIKLDPASYTKRTKLYNNQVQWIDTIPNKVSLLPCLALVPYENKFSLIFYNNLNSNYEKGTNLVNILYSNNKLSNRIDKVLFDNRNLASRLDILGNKYNILELIPTK